MKKLAALLLVSLASCITPLKQADLDTATEQQLVQTLLDRYNLNSAGFSDEPYQANKRMLRAEIVSRQADWVEPYRSAVINGHLMIGMTDAQALIARGRPTSIHRSRYADAIQEQWVYRIGGYYALYVYFDGGVLTAIQD